LEFDEGHLRDEEGRLSDSLQGGVRIERTSFQRTSGRQSKKAERKCGWFWSGNLGVRMLGNLEDWKKGVGDDFGAEWRFVIVRNPFEGGGRLGEKGREDFGIGGK
jgi:hypothetical protein